MGVWSFPGQGCALHGKERLYVPKTYVLMLKVKKSNHHYGLSFSLGSSVKVIH